MRHPTWGIGCVLCASALLIGAANAPAAETLGEILRQSKWDRLVGTWVDAETKGARSKMVYAWKFPDRVIEAISTEGDKQAVSLMGVDGRTGDVFLMSADNQGTSALGTWGLADNGDAVLGLGFATSEGVEGTLSLRYHLEDDDTLTTTVELAEPIVFKWIRVKSPQ